MTVKIFLPVIDTFGLSLPPDRVLVTRVGTTA